MRRRATPVPKTRHIKTGTLLNRQRPRHLKTQLATLRRLDHRPLVHRRILSLNRTGNLHMVPHVEVGSLYRIRRLQPRITLDRHVVKLVDALERIPNADRSNRAFQQDRPPVLLPNYPVIRPIDPDPHAYNAQPKLLSRIRWRDPRIRRRRAVSLYTANRPLTNRRQRRQPNRLAVRPSLIHNQITVRRRRRLHVHRPSTRILNDVVGSPTPPTSTSHYLLRYIKTVKAPNIQHHPATTTGTTPPIPRLVVPTRSINLPTPSHYPSFNDNAPPSPRTLVIVNLPT